jgi:hypothetical protein
MCGFIILRTYLPFWSAVAKDAGCNARIPHSTASDSMH